MIKYLMLFRSIGYVLHTSYRDTCLLTVVNYYSGQSSTEVSLLEIGLLPCT